MLALLLLTGVFLLQRNAVIAQIENLVARHCARATLQTWGLAPTPENLELYAAMSGTRNQAARPARVAPTTNEFFTAHWRYAELWRDRPLTIGIYNQNQTDAEQLFKALRLPAALQGKVLLHNLATERAFLEALEHDDMVMFWGHANYGRGLFFDPARGGHGTLQLGHEFITVPRDHLETNDTIVTATDPDRVLVRRSADALAKLTVRCKVFWCLACRSEVYYRDMWTNQYPHCHLVATHFNWKHSNNGRVLEELLAGLEQRWSLAAIIENFNAKHTDEVLPGRFTELAKYGNHTNHHSRLLSFY